MRFCLGFFSKKKDKKTQNVSVRGHHLSSPTDQSTYNGAVCGFLVPNV